MDHFLIYIIVSSIVTLISVTFAYKHEEEELRLVDFVKNELDGGHIENAPVYSEQSMKATNSSTIGKSLEASLS